MALDLISADCAARALCTELGVAEMQDIFVPAWLVALGREWPGGPLSAPSNLVLYEYGSADQQLSWFFSQPEANTEEFGSVPVKQTHLLSLENQNLRKKMPTNKATICWVNTSEREE